MSLFHSRRSLPILNTKDGTRIAWLPLLLGMSMLEPRGLAGAEPSYKFDHFAGSTGGPGYVEATGSAARFANPAGLVVNRNGDILVADRGNRVIRKITAAGVVTTVIGSLDTPAVLDGVGAAARLSFPMGLAIDSGENLYFTDDGTVLRKVTPDGRVTTLAGSPGEIGSVDGIGAAARFYSPSGVAVNSKGEIFVADRLNHTVRKVTPAGVVTTFAGVPGQGGSYDSRYGQPTFTLPEGIAVDASDNLYLPKVFSAAVRKITPAGIVTTLASDGGTWGATYYPVGAAVDAQGNIYVADRSNRSVRKITANGFHTTVSGQFYGPEWVAVDPSGGLVVSDTANQAICRVTLEGKVTAIAGGNGAQAALTDGLGTSARFDNPDSVSVDSDGNLYVADFSNDAVRKITSGGDVTTIARWIKGPRGVAAARNQVFVTSGNVVYDRYLVIVAGSDDGSSGAGARDGVGRAALFNWPTALVFDGAKTLFVADAGNGTIRKIYLDDTFGGAGVVTTLAGAAGQFASVDGAGAAARFKSIHGLARDATGVLFVVEESTVRKVTPTGMVTTLAGKADDARIVDGPLASARFQYLNGIAVDRLGNLFLTESAGVIRRLGTDGNVTTIGGRVSRFGTDDGWGEAALFNSPQGIAIDRFDTLYVADAGNHAIRRGRLPSAPPPMLTPDPSQFSVAIADASTFQWVRNGTVIAGAVTSKLPSVDRSTGLYAVWVTQASGSTLSNYVIYGPLGGSKVSGQAEEVGHNIYVESNHNTFDQVLLTGAEASVLADYQQITRISFVDEDNDIVQVEFSGPGTMSLVLDNPTGPATPVNYNQATTYMKGHAGIVITGATEQTNVSVFSVGRQTAVNQALFKEGVSYDGIADIAFIAIASANGKFGGVRTANANYFAAKGYTGLYAPGVTFMGPVFIGNVTAFDTATPVIQVGSVSDARITGGDLAQANGAAVQVSGLTQLKFTAGSDSHGKDLPAQANKAVLRQDGVDVTAQIVVGP